MCNFFSFVGDGHGNYRYMDWEWRKDHLREQNDSHTYILTHYKVPPAIQDRWSKYEYHPLTKAFTVDQGVEGHDQVSAEAWVNTLDFKRVVEPLIIKPIVSPLSRKRKPTEQDIADLKVWSQVGDQVWDQVGDQVGEQVWAQVAEQVWDQVGDQVWDQVGDQVGEQVWAQVAEQVWDQVRDQVGDQVGDQVWDQVWDQVGEQVWDQVWDQVGEQVWAQVGEQVWAQVRAQVYVYISTFFDITYTFCYSAVSRLWARGFVPVFNGDKWLLLSGKKAETVYEWTPERSKP
jgi:hypothetical protein